MQCSPFTPQNVCGPCLDGFYPRPFASDFPENSLCYPSCSFENSRNEYLLAYDSPRIYNDTWEELAIPKSLKTSHRFDALCSAVNREYNCPARYCGACKKGFVPQYQISGIWPNSVACVPLCESNFECPDDLPEIGDVCFLRGLQCEFEKECPLGDIRQGDVTCRRTKHATLQWRPSEPVDLCDTCMGVMIPGPVGTVITTGDINYFTYGSQFTTGSDGIRISDLLGTTAVRLMSGDVSDVIFLICGDDGSNKPDLGACRCSESYGNSLTPGGDFDDITLVFTDNVVLEPNKNYWFFINLDVQGVSSDVRFRVDDDPSSLLGGYFLDGVDALCPESATGGIFLSFLPLSFALSCPDEDFECPSGQPEIGDVCTAPGEVCPYECPMGDGQNVNFKCSFTEDGTFEWKLSGHECDMCMHFATPADMSNIATIGATIFYAQSSPFTTGPDGIRISGLLATLGIKVLSGPVNDVSYLICNDNGNDGPDFGNCDCSEPLGRPLVSSDIFDFIPLEFTGKVILEPFTKYWFAFIVDLQNSALFFFEWKSSVTSGADTLSYRSDSLCPTSPLTSVSSIMGFSIAFTLTCPGMDTECPGELPTVGDDCPTLAKECSYPETCPLGDIRHVNVQCKLTGDGSMKWQPLQPFELCDTCMGLMMPADGSNTECISGPTFFVVSSLFTSDDIRISGLLATLGIKTTGGTVNDVSYLICNDNGSDGPDFGNCDCSEPLGPHLGTSDEFDFITLEFTKEVILDPSAKYWFAFILELDGDVDVKWKSSVTSGVTFTYEGDGLCPTSAPTLISEIQSTLIGFTLTCPAVNFECPMDQPKIGDVCTALGEVCHYKCDIGGVQQVNFKCIFTEGGTFQWELSAPFDQECDVCTGVMIPGTDEVRSAINADYFTYGSQFTTGSDGIRISDLSGTTAVQLISGAVSDVKFLICDDDGNNEPDMSTCRCSESYGKLMVSGTFDDITLVFTENVFLDPTTNYWFFINLEVESSPSVVAFRGDFESSTLNGYFLDGVDALCPATGGTFISFFPLSFTLSCPDQQVIM